MGRFSMCCIGIILMLTCSLSAAEAPETRALQVAVMDANANILPGVSLAASSVEGFMIKAEPLPDGTHYVDRIGTKTAIEIEHPDYGDAFVELLIPQGLSLASARIVWLADGSVDASLTAAIGRTNPVPARGAATALLGGGEDCSSATVIAALPFSDTGSTVGAVDDYDETCPYAASGAGDVTYVYTPAADMVVNISLCAGTDYDSKLYVYEGTCGPYQSGVFVACNDDACGLVSELEGVFLVGGNTYYIVIDGYGLSEGNYTLDFWESEICDVECPDDATPEGEPDCGLPEDTVNGGCNADTPVFSPLACGEAVCGTAVWDGTTRDTDWYEITVAEPTVFTWAVEAEFPVLFGLVETDPPGAGDCDFSTGYLNPYGLVAECEPAAAMSDPLPAGTYWFFVAPDFNGPTFACGAEYTAALTCEAAPTTGACCFPDGSCTEGTEAECGDAGGVFQGLGTDCASTECPVVPENDLCEDAIGPLDVPSMTMGSTTAASIDDWVPFCGTAVTSPGVWYSVIGTGTMMTASTCGPLYDFDTKISVYCLGCDEPLCVNGNDDDCPDGASTLLSTVSWCSQAGAEYLILVHAFGGQTGDFELYLEEDGVSCMPEVFCISIGSCCLDDGTCLDGLTEAECIGFDGTYQGDDTTCEGGFLGFTVEDCDNPFEDITGTGTPLVLGDDDGVTVPVGFDFNFYGDVHSDIGIASNGYLTFGDDLTDFSNDTIPDSFDPNDLIAPFWDDLSPNAGGTIHYETLGTAPDRRFIAQWTDVPQYGAGDANTFQAILYEGSNCIEFRYGDFTPEGFAGDYTVGIENQDGSDGESVDTAALMPGDCVSFCPEYTEPIVCPLYEEGFLDIKPGSCPNPLNPKSWGVLPVALVGAEDFDVMDVDLATVTLSRADGIGGSAMALLGDFEMNFNYRNLAQPSMQIETYGDRNRSMAFSVADSGAVSPNEGPPGPHSGYEDVATPFEGELCDCHELGADGFMDLSMKFRNQEVVGELMLNTASAGDMIELVLTGEFADGTAFMASDCVRIVGGGGAILFLR